MKTTFKAKQEVEFKIPQFPNFITTNTGSIAIEALSEENIAAIFDSMKQNALEYATEKNKVVPVDLTKQGEKLVKKIG